MSEQIKEIFYHAMLARAAYANLEPGMLPTEVRTRIMGGQSKMTTGMADYFQQHFDFLTSNIDSWSGYDGFIFQGHPQIEWVIFRRVYCSA